MRALALVAVVAVAGLVAVAVGVHPGESFPGRPGQIAFAARQGGDWEIFVAAADGSRLRQLTRNLLDDSAPVWSPDGTRIVFRSDRAGNAEIFTVAPDGGGLRRLTRNNVPDTRPSWAPDGERIVFQRFVAGGSGLDPRTAEIYVMNADGTGARRLTRNQVDDLNPSWSPTGGGSPSGATETATGSSTS